ncbi:hypothetical protein FC84_GL001668 [Lapidilactobacillus dextrinicus DSM 20335]|uniref:YopX protein domain-containing protein n=1 Tax=Lapidilactobacillus dextrinicus DSM 20335 TaxID=1423738 RepID=A0A0R2BK24_9LACO|nr:YopX family protein [Lapidilactobacillus dextrinicus]KRM79488.1 hypothetical protein FC84_GL001668 [Lapidilactobacillus dextrinicus DSM 20335]QFG46678.1 hypothetical protein LH506_04115 [Lapidilactobacillus dextrinicus]
MRIIKYRIWDSKIKQYATEDYQFLISRTGDLWGSVGDWLGVHFNEDAGFQIEQYTGINDVKGKPVYEGDIVKVYRQWIDQVVFEQGCFGLKASNYHSFVPLSELNGAIKLIGNIHEDVNVVGE